MATSRCWPVPGAHAAICCSTQAASCRCSPARWAFQPPLDPPSGRRRSAGNKQKWDGVEYTIEELKDDRCGSAAQSQLLPKQPPPSPTFTSCLGAPATATPRSQGRPVPGRSHHATPPALHSRVAPQALRVATPTLLRPICLFSSLPFISPCPPPQLQGCGHRALLRRRQHIEKVLPHRPGRRQRGHRQQQRFPHDGRRPAGAPPGLLPP